jgi:fatty-acyl-CoA synthase
MSEKVGSYYHCGGLEPLTGMTIPEHFAEVVRRCGAREAIVSRHQQRRLTYRQLAAEVDDLARGLLAMGYQRGERIGVWATNSIEWLLLQMATARIGVALVAINPGYRRQEIAYAIQHSEVHGLFVMPAFRRSDYLAMLAEVLPPLQNPERNLKHADFPFLRQVVLFDPRSPATTPRLLPGLTLWQEVLAAGSAVSPAALDAATAALDRDDTIALLYTSGSMGFPKTAVLSHHNILNNAWFTARRMAFTETDRLCAPVPFYHCFGMVLANLLCLAVGACLVVPEEYFDPLATMGAIEAEGCTALYGVPTMFLAQREPPRRGDFDLTSLRTGIRAGAPCPPILMRRVMEEMPCPEILIGYGMTEASPVTHLTAAEDSLEVRLETVGRNLPHQEVKLIDPDSGVTVSVGTVGEVCFRGYHVAKGYYGDPEATALGIDADGWLHSGDLGIMDGDGYLRITGRRKEIIIRGGENICPWQIEQQLLQHPKVAEVAVFGLPDEFYGEQIMAWVRLKSGERADAEELKAHCRSGLAHFKVPAQIWIVAEFPKTGSGKLHKPRMRELSLEWLAHKTI